MELYLIPDDPTCTLLVSTNNVTHYKILTHTNLGLCMSRLISTTTRKKHRPGIQLGSAAAIAFGGGNGSHVNKNGPSSGMLVADIVWGNGRTGTPTNIISDAIDPDLRITRRRWLKKNVGNLFGRASRNFEHEGLEYQWKTQGKELVLTCLSNKTTVARHSSSFCGSGAFHGQNTACLRIEPMASVDMDIVVLSFLLLDKTWRRSMEDDLGYYDETHGDDDVEVGDGSGA